MVDQDRDGRLAQMRTMQAIGELVVRVEERVRSISDRIAEMGKRADTQDAKLSDIVTRMRLTESRFEQDRTAEGLRTLLAEVRDIADRLRDVEVSTDRTDGRADQIKAFLVKIVFAAVSAYVLWRLHLTPLDH
ncbi:MAG: hypothetical protein ACRYGG_20905 [Janthinobacterium lividum]